MFLLGIVYFYNNSINDDCLYFKLLLLRIGNIRDIREGWNKFIALIPPGTSIHDNKRNNVVIPYRSEFISKVFPPPPLLHPSVAITFSKVDKSVVPTGLRTDQETAEGSPPGISSIVRNNEHQGRFGCSDTGIYRSPCYSFEVGYTFIFSLNLLATFYSVFPELIEGTG